MPNWCSTNISVYGPEDELKEFHKGINTEDGIIKSYFPVPEELQITSTFAFSEIPENWKEWVADGTWTQADYDQRVAENAKMRKLQDDNLAKYGYKDWYDWCIAHWGTKWGDCETSVDEPKADSLGWSMHGWFQTAWGTATPAWLEISKKFPNLIFYLSSDEEAGFFEGVEIVKNGSLHFEDYYEPCEYPEEVDWDDDDSIDAYNEWKSEKMGTIETNANLVLNTLLGVAPVPPKAFVTTEEKPKPKPFVWK